MRVDLSRSDKAAGVETNCLIRMVAETMRSEPRLEAVKIDRSANSISLATLGKPDNSELERTLTLRIRRIQEDLTGPRCALLDGEPDCSTCSRPLPAAERQAITIEHSDQGTTIARVTCPTAPTFWRWRKIPLPKFVPREVEFLESADHADEWKPQLLAACLCGLLGLLAWALFPHTASFGVYLLAYAAGSWFTAQEVWERMQKRSVDVHFLMLTVAAGSAAIGAWGEGTTLLFLFSFSSALEHYAMGRSQREISSLFKAAPKVAVALDDAGREFELPVESLRLGMKLLVRPGAQFPVDSEILKGKTAADESNLTGEAIPVDKEIGDMVFGGTLNIWGAVEVLVLRSAAESSLQKIIRLIHEAQQHKAPAQRFTDKFSAHYTYVVLGLSFVMFFVWWLVFGLAPFISTGTERSAFYRSMTLLVVASPCALVLSIPSAVLAAIAWAARRGVLFRGGAAVEKLAEVRVVAMDKTGTLTTGELQVQRIESFPPGRECEVAALAYSLEKLSTHPLARAITRYGKQASLPALELREFESIPGAGLQARYDGHAVKLGKRDWLAEGEEKKIIRRVPQTEPGFSEVWLAGEGLLGRILLRDDIRPQARNVVEQLRRLGLRSVVLTGDRHATADHLKSQLHLDDVRAELNPNGKVEAIQSFTRQNMRVAMIGDGVNDAPSLAAAHVGVAMGARGSDAALEQAEVVLMHDRLENFLAAFLLSQRARRIIRQNLALSLGTVVILVVFALAGRIPLTLGVVGHEGSTVIVVMNSLRLLLFKSSPPSPTVRPLISAA
jgi:Cd2+/Zn2+-exporting ATPase